MMNGNNVERARKIIHMDLDAFFCAVEELKDPSLKGKPFAVGGNPHERGVIASCSYAARRYGVHSAMPTSQAIKLCPQLLLVSSGHGEYSRKSREVMEILSNFTPLLEQISIDEAFLDVSDLPQSGEEIASQIKNRIWTETHLSASFGVACNKLVAKIANDYGKKQSQSDSYPGVILAVKNGDEANFLAPLPANMLWGVGPKTAEKLKLMGIKTIGDLAHIPESSLITHFGKNGVFLKQRASGIDKGSVESYDEIKSISQEVTFSEDILEIDTLIEEIRSISNKLGFRLRNDHLHAQIVRVKIRYYDFHTFTRQRKLNHAFNQDSVIFDNAVRIFEQNWDKKSPIRLIGVGVSKFITQGVQLNLWETEDDKERKLLEAVDALKQKFGDKVIQRASGIEYKKKRRSAN